MTEQYNALDIYRESIESGVNRLEALGVKLHDEAQKNPENTILVETYKEVFEISHKMRNGLNKGAIVNWHEMNGTVYKLQRLGLEEKVIHS